MVILSEKLISKPAGPRNYKREMEQIKLCGFTLRCLAKSERVLDNERDHLRPWLMKYKGAVEI